MSFEFREWECDLGIKKLHLYLFLKSETIGDKDRNVKIHILWSNHSYCNTLIVAYYACLLVGIYRHTHRPVHIYIYEFNIILLVLAKTWNNPMYHQCTMYLFKGNIPYGINHF